jgi:hypothetical protein
MTTEDWSKSIDDMGPSDWEDFLGGPNDDELEKLDDDNIIGKGFGKHEDVKRQSLMDRLTSACT